MGYSPCILANFGHFQNALIVRILYLFWSGFLHISTLMWSYNHFSRRFGIFNFLPKLIILHGLKPMHIGQFWPFSKCSHFSNIRCFLERFFLHRKTLMCSYNDFSHRFGIFNFWPKLTIFHGLYPMHIGQFWPFSKCSYCSNIICFGGRFFAHNNSNVVVQWFFSAVLKF